MQAYGSPAVDSQEIGRAGIDTMTDAEILERIKQDLTLKGGICCFCEKEIIDDRCKCEEYQPLAA